MSGDRVSESVASEQAAREKYQMLRDSTKKNESEEATIEADNIRRKQLMYASSLGDEEKVHEILKEGVDPNFIDEDGNSALHKASWFGHQNVVKVILAAGGDANIKDEVGETPLHKASERGHSQIVELLHNFGAKVTARSEIQGRTVCRRNSFKITNCKKSLPPKTSWQRVEVRGSLRPRRWYCPFRSWLDFRGRFVPPGSAQHSEQEACE